MLKRESDGEDLIQMFFVADIRRNNSSSILFFAEVCHIKIGIEICNN